jgi:hypothetical protein
VVRVPSRAAPSPGASVRGFRAVAASSPSLPDILELTLLNHERGPRAAGTEARFSPVADHPQVEEASRTSRERFADAEQDGP